MISELQRERNPVACHDRKSRWYHYALRRLPASLLISLVTLFFVVPILLCLGLAVYRWLAE